jgi:hypothetical protein
MCDRITCRFGTTRQSLRPSENQVRRNPENPAPICRFLWFSPNIDSCGSLQQMSHLPDFWHQNLLKSVLASLIDSLTICAHCRYLQNIGIESVLYCTRLQIMKLRPSAVICCHLQPSACIRLSEPPPPLPNTQGEAANGLSLRHVAGTAGRGHRIRFPIARVSNRSKYAQVDMPYPFKWTVTCIEVAIPSAKAAFLQVSASTVCACHGPESDLKVENK